MSSPHGASFLKSKETLNDAMNLAHQEDDRLIADCTDASDKVWAKVLTLIHSSQTTMETKNQQHEFLSFLEGKFMKSQENWKINEKEVFKGMKVF